MVALKISRSPFRKYLNLSISRQVTRTAPVSLSKIYPLSPRLEIQKSISHSVQPESEICYEIAPIHGANTADIAQPSPAPLDPPDSDQKPNLDNQVLRQFGTHELNIFVFVIFTFIIGSGMGAGKVISTGSYGFEKNIGFTILYAIGEIPAL